MTPGLINKLMEWFITDSARRQEFARAEREFFSCDIPDHSDVDELHQGWFTEWFIFDFKLKNGQTMLEEFVEKNPLGLRERELREYEMLRVNEYGPYEILAVERGRGMTLKHLVSGNEYTVREKKGTRDVQIGHVIFARVGRALDGKWELVGSDSVFWPVRLGEHSKRQFAREKRVYTPLDINKLFPEGSAKPIETSKPPKVRDWRGDEIDAPPTLAEAEARVSALIGKYGLDEMISTELIKRWMDEAMKARDLSFLTLVTGLLPYDKYKPGKKDINEWIEALMALHQVLPLNALGGKSPLEKAAEDPDRPADIETDQIPIMSGRWFEEDYKGHEAMKKGNAETAVRQFGAAFTALYEDKAVWREVYRQYANKAMAHFMNGDPELGEEMIRISLELNPNYDFARQLKERLDRGDFSETIMAGVIERTRRLAEDPTHPINLWPEEELRSWSDERLMLELAKRGVKTDKESFRRVTKDCINLQDFTEEFWYPSYTGAIEDEDLVWKAADELFRRWCPERYTIDGLWQAIWNLEDVSSAETKSGIDRAALESALAEVFRFGENAPDKIFSEWSGERYEANLKWTLIDCLFLSALEGFSSQAFAIAEVYERRTGDIIFRLARAGKQFSDDENGWQIELDGILAEQPYDLYPHLFMAMSADVIGNADKEEFFLLSGLNTVLRRERDKIEVADVMSDTIYRSYERIYEALLEFYEEVEDKNKLEQTAEEYDVIQVRREELEPLLSPEEKKRVEDKQQEFKQKIFAEDPAWQYYRWLKPYGINFATKELTKTPLTMFNPQGGKVKIGRNDPCPCDAEKDGKRVKYKKCHG